MKTFLFVLLFVPGLAHADIINIAGTETGDTSEYQAIAGTIGSTTSFVHSGGYSLRVNPASIASFAKLGSFNATTGANAVTGVNASTGCAGFYFMYQTKPASKDEQLIDFLNSAGTLKFALRLNSAGNVVGCDANLLGVATGTTVIALGTWYHFEVKVGSGTSAFYEFKINGTVEFSGTGNMLADGSDSIRVGKGVNRNSQSIDFYYDDIVWSSITYASDGKVLLMRPNANGTNQNFTVGAGVGSHFQLVNDVPTDGDTSYLVSTLVTTSSETFRFQTTGTVGISGTVNFVRIGGTTKQDVTSGAMATRVISGATTFTTAGNFATTAAYTFRGYPFPTDPNTSNAWTLAALDAVEGGVREGSTANKSRLTAVYTIVHFTPPANVFRGFGNVQ